MTKFSNWLDTLVSEKAIDLNALLAVAGPSGENLIPVGCVVDAIKAAPSNEQQGIKSVITRIDFLNGDVVSYFRHLAQAIAV